MAVRPVYVSTNSPLFFDRIDIEFKFHAGFSVKQKQANIKELHSNFSRLYPDRKLLEVSSKSLTDLGINLSAFNLKADEVSLECAFQSSKVFEHGGPFRDLLSKTSRESKKDDRLKSSGKLVKFNYRDLEFIALV